MKVTGTQLEMVRGDSESIRISVSGKDLEPTDFAELTIRKSVKMAAVIHKKEYFTNGDNSVVISFAPEDTSKLSFGEYVYDVQLTYGGNVKTVIAPSPFLIGEEVTYGNID